MGDAEYLRAKAAQCRRLAAGISVAEDPAAAALLALAEEFEARAAVVDKREGSAAMSIE